MIGKANVMSNCGPERREIRDNPNHPQLENKNFLSIFDEKINYFKNIMYVD